MNILSNSGRLAYGIKRFMVKNAEDIKSIPLTPQTRPGSTVFVTSDSSRYILDEDYSWVKINSANGGGEDTPESVIYEGGDISKG